VEEAPAETIQGEGGRAGNAAVLDRPSYAGSGGVVLDVDASSIQESRRCDGNVVKKGSFFSRTGKRLRFGTLVGS